MELKKTVLGIFLFGLSIVNPLKAKDNEDLSFLKGQKNLKFEFIYDGFTINDEPEDDYLKKEVNEKEILDKWKEERESQQKLFVEKFNEQLDGFGFKGLINSDEAKYVCVIRLVSIKTGKNNFTKPQIWIEYTFYERTKRDKIFAQYTNHQAYGQENARKGGPGPWYETYHIIRAEGWILANHIRKEAELKKR